MQNTHEITIKNCNSIVEAKLTLQKHSLNIKYGPNGLGKSTIARSLALEADPERDLFELLPFKFRGADSPPTPEVSGAEDIESVLIFDEEYVSQFTFQQDEVLKNSFEIFIDTDEYREGLRKVDKMLRELKDSISTQPEFESALTSFAELKEAFSITKEGGVSKKSRGYRALSISGKFANIPENLSGFQDFLQSDDPAGWVTWQSKGKNFLELSDRCPFCSSKEIDKDTTEKVSEEYESAAVKNMSQLRDVVKRVGEYFAPDHLQQLNAVMKSLDELSLEDEDVLIKLRNDVDSFLESLRALQNLSFHSLQDIGKVPQTLRTLRIDLSGIPSLGSDKTKDLVDLLNSELHKVTGKVNDLRKELGAQKSVIRRLIRDNQESINNFLGTAGYRYQVKIEPFEDSYRMIVEHLDAPGHVKSASRHLSYGERNAFALVLFMHHVLRASPDLVVLDDPVSSFDKTKKFGILHQLFHGSKSIRNYTTLFLTHDIEPAIDVVRISTSKQFAEADPVAHFLRSQEGIIQEQQITKADISTFTKICEDNIREATDTIIKCIYLRRRYEVHGDLGLEYNLLSSLLHARESPDLQTDQGQRVTLTDDQISIASKNILKDIPEFDYKDLLREIKDPAALKQKFTSASGGYEKLQLFRIMLESSFIDAPKDPVFMRMINESYHIENEQVMQLNPRTFDAIPEYIIDRCSNLVAASDV